jgi:hypothetical protein
MKTLKTTFAFLVIALFTISCSKSDEATPTSKVYPEENFLDGYLALSQFNQVTSDITLSAEGELGTEFTPLVTGKITNLKIKIPISNPALRITLWDKAAVTIIKTETVNVATANTLFTFDINDIDLVKNKAYIISANSASFYQRTKIGDTNTIYPITSGNIRVDGVKGGASQIMPTNSVLNYYLGDFSFNFQQTE